MIVCLTMGSFDQRVYILRQYGIPLVALDYIVAANCLDTSDDLSLWGYLTKSGPPAWDDKLQSEWFSRETESGLLPPATHVSIADASRHVAFYSFSPYEKSISLATADALTKLLIEKGLITEAEFMQRLPAERAEYRTILEKTR